MSDSTNQESEPEAVDESAEEEDSEKKAKRQVSRTAMAIGLAAHVWSYHDYIWHPVHPDPQAQAAMEQRVRDLLIPAVEAT